jgi:protein-tyrosine-phosphatase
VEARVLRNLSEMPLDEQLAVRGARDRLIREFGSSLDEDVIDAYLLASWEHMDTVARVKVHIPLLAERFARAQLWAQARIRGDRPGVPAVVFVDTNDSGRARMAKALFLRRSGAHGFAFSAGTDPNEALDEVVSQVMHEIDITTTEAFPKPWTPQILEAADRVVTFADGAPVPVPDPSRHRVWDVPDPRGKDPEQVRVIRDSLAALVDGLADELGIPPANE